MSQHDYILDNQDGASFRADANNALQALASVNSGATEPVAPYAYMLWVDTANAVIKQRNAGNTAWTTMATIGKTLLANDSSQIAKAWVNFNGTGTVAIRAAYNVSSITDNGVGTYAVNFTTAMADTNYSVTITSRRTNSADINFSATLKPTATSGTNYPLSTGSCDVVCGTVTNATLIDSDIYCVAVYR